MTKELRDAAKAAETMITSGLPSFASALERLPNLSDKAVTAMVRSSEAGARLGEGFGQIVNILNARSALRRAVHDHRLHKHVRFLGFLPDDTLAILYRLAALFVVPSLYEGFGIPMIEAMSQGVPVACSRASSLPEVGGETVAYFDPDDTKAMAKSKEKEKAAVRAKGKLASAAKAAIVAKRAAAAAKRAMSAKKFRSSCAMVLRISGSPGLVITLAVFSGEAWMMATPFSPSSWPGLQITSPVSVSTISSALRCSGFSFSTFTCSIS
jgi:hypothetical protein